MLDKFKQQARIAPSLFALCALAGLFHGFSMAWPGEGTPVWWLQLVSLASLCAFLRRATSWRSAAGMTWLFAIAWLVGSFWWLFISMHEHGGLPAPLAGFGVMALAGLLAVYYGVAGGLFIAGARGHPVWDSFLFAALWLGAELARGTFLTGFPWAVAGYAHTEGPFSGLAAWVGVYGISTFVALSAGLLSTFVPALIVRAPHSHGLATLACTALVSVVVWSASHWRMEAQPHGRPMRMALLQGNIAQEQKFDLDTGVATALDWYGQALRETSADLLVTAETAIPLLPQDLPDGYLSELQISFSQASRAALVGMPLGSIEGRYTNSVVGLGPVSKSGDYQYDKHHLVPFGEFSPHMFGWLTRMMNIPLGDFARGPAAQNSFEWQGQRLAPNICFEDLFGEELAARFRDVSRAPTILVNLSNIAWFGNTVAIDQHLQISRMRAMEFRRPVVRATNTGATAAIDAYGQITEMLTSHTRGVLIADVQGASGITPFVWWSSRFGIWPLWLLVLIGSCLTFWLPRHLSARSLINSAEMPACLTRKSKRSASMLDENTSFNNFRLHK
jgi:apolipoprotein N-acyltransferase